MARDDTTVMRDRSLRTCVVGLAAAAAVAPGAAQAAPPAGNLRASQAMPTYAAGLTRGWAATRVPRRRIDRRRTSAADAPLDGLHAVWANPALLPVAAGSGAVVAIVDSGADLGHPGLRDHLWTNAGEVPANGIDDDGNGSVDDVHGLNVLAPGTPPADGYGHGTAVAGLVAATDADPHGVTGAAPGARLMIVRVLGDDGEGNTEQLARGIAYAVRNGASVINCSVNSEFDSPAVDTAIQSAADAGIPVIAAAGNSAANLDETTTYPASTDSPAVVSVAATQSAGQLASFSNYGAHSVDIAAPGVDLLTTYTDDSYTTLSGTSAAAPLVAAALADERTAMPGATLAQLRDSLLASAVRGQIPVISGELDAAAAIDSLAGSREPAPVIPAISVTPRFTRRGARMVVRTRWTLKTALAVPLDAVLRVRAGSGHGKVLARHDVVLRGSRGTLSAVVAFRAHRAGRLWLELRTTGTAGAAGVRVAARVSSR